MEDGKSFHEEIMEILTWNLRRRSSKNNWRTCIQNKPSHYNMKLLTIKHLKLDRSIAKVSSSRPRGFPEL